MIKLGKKNKKNVVKYEAGQIAEGHAELLMAFISDKEYKPMRFKDIAMILNVPKSERVFLDMELSDLVSQGKIELDEKGCYRLSKKGSYSGIFMSTQKGFGFVRAEEFGDDIFVSADDTNGALDGDKVEVKLITTNVRGKHGPSGKHEEGVVIKILERDSHAIVGTFTKMAGDNSKSEARIAKISALTGIVPYGIVVPDNQKYNFSILIDKKKSVSSADGAKVVVQITDYGNPNEYGNAARDDKRNSINNYISQDMPKGIITREIGHKDDPGVDVLSVVFANGIPVEVPEEVTKQLQTIPEEVAEEDKQGRLDLRDEVMFTIDGDDTKDFDDAVSLKYENGVYTLGVHIADVTNYVTEGSALDKDALKRGTSVYLADRVVPMLPHQLSNGICSLNEGTDRLTLSCIMQVDDEGNIIGHKMAETLVNINKRMTYNKVAELLEVYGTEKMKDAGPLDYEEYAPVLLKMQELSHKLRKKRMARGSIDFDFQESKLIVDERGKVIDIKPYIHNEATRLIEDFMLAANETVAEDYYWQQIPFLYRVHEKPDEEKMDTLTEFIRGFGYALKMPKGEIHPKEIQKLLKKVKGTDEENVISTQVLRSMRQARYSPECLGHFGLAAKYYAHFTSPIRRYPDLQIHRIIKESLEGKLTDERIKHYESILTSVGDSTSKTERRADETEREVEKIKKAEYMEQFVGHTFEGVISGLTSWGIFVQLPNTVEGMIRTALLMDYYEMDESTYTLVGRDSGNIFRLGQKLRILVTNAEKATGTVSFMLADPSLESGKMW